MDFNLMEEQINLIGSILSNNENAYKKANKDLFARKITASEYKKNVQELINSYLRIKEQLKGFIPNLRGQAKKAIKDCLKKNRQIVKELNRAVRTAEEVLRV